MHTIISSVLSFFLSPANWIIILFVLAFFSRKKSLKKICSILAVSIFILFSNQWLLSWYATKWQPAPVRINNNIVYSCGIVAGGFASPDADGNGYFNATADRFIQAEKLYKLGNISHILISGGNGKKENENFREGMWVKEELITVGIPDSVIFVEDRSNDTFDNAVYARQILDSAKLKPPYLLITSAYHVPRASLIFKSAGLETIPFPCNYLERNNGFSISSFIPSISVLLAWKIFLKETAGYLYYYFKLK